MRSGTVADEPKRTFVETARRTQIVAAAIDTIAEVGYARASLARIAQRLAISRGLISYHFAGKDELITQVVSEIIEQGKAYMTPRILAERPGPDMLRAYIESNLSFMREHRNYMVAMAEIARNGLTADGRQRFYGDADMEGFARDLQDALAGLQAGGDLRPDFDPRVMALAIRAAIDAVARRLAHDPDLDIDNYARELARLFELVTRVVE
jgi:TetR/AcrR family transcriptional regulator, fatty acid metabolism regulator protein